MTRKDYVLLARALRSADFRNFPVEDDEASAETVVEQWNSCVNAIALALSKDNERFNSMKFREACGQYD